MIPRPESTEKPADISKVIDLVIKYNPNLAMADLGTIRMWVSEGCDIDKDIIPTIERLTKNKKGIGVFKYFTNAILEARDKRLIAAPATIIKTEKTHPSDFAKAYAWKR